MKELKIAIAAFIALFVVLSPAFYNLALKPEAFIPNAGVVEPEIKSLNDTAMVGLPAPNPDMKYLNGGKIELEAFRGKTVVVYLWSTWCPGCPKGLWHMNQLHLKKENPDFVVLAANMGFRDRQEEIEHFVKRRNLTLPVVICTPEVMAQFNIKGIPAVFIIDSQGTIQYEALGPINEEEFEEKLKQVVEP